MYTHRRLARDYIKGTSRTDFWDIVNEAKISDDDKEILDARFVHGHSYVKISADLHVSVEKVKTTIENAYDKISKII